MVRVDTWGSFRPLVSRCVSLLQAMARLQGTRSSSVYIVRRNAELVGRSGGRKFGLRFVKQRLS